ncbi:hypothetical protein JCM33374_g6545 [Metschnikowia sp. JCM 33374]|nr:hypothetical protein JCM33374_g6545 [Metschnikowia sp. JCM 33374]
MSITGTSPDVATMYLEKFHWNINEAANAYLNENHDSTPNSSVTASKALVDLFDRYKDPENNTIISIDGTLSYLEDLNIDPEDSRSLTLSYLLKSPQTGEFPRSNFLDFWAANRVNSIPAMKQFIDQSHSRIKNSPSSYEDFYQYCFDFIRGSDVRIKYITHEDAVSYWGLLFGERQDLAASAERLAQWYEFVESSKKPITRDTWVMFYKFLLEVINTDPVSLSGYDEMSSWPSMVDEYIEWLYENGHLEEN